MGDNYEQDYGIVLMELFQALKEKIALITAVTLIAAILGWGFSVFLITPEYEASVNMIVNARTDTTVSMTYDDLTSAQKLVNTYAIIIKSNTVLNQVIDELGLNMKYADLYDMVSVYGINNTQVMKVACRCEDPNLARQIVATISIVAPDIVRDAVEAGSCKVVSQVAVGDKPVSPDILENAVIAGALGLLLCVALVVLRELMNDFIVDERDVERKLGIPTLGIIPDVEGK